MHRRNFSTGLIAAGLASPVVLTANKSIANPSGGDRDDKRDDAFAQLSRVILILGLQRIIITYLIILNPLGLLGLNLRSPVPQFNQNRASVAKVPLLGGLFRPTLKDRFHPATLIGTVFLLNSLLVIAPRRGPVSDVSKVVIAHQKLSWEPNKRPRKMQMSNIPTLGTLKKHGTLLGSALQTKRELLVLVRPSIVESDF